jgi:hypothetical protein
LTVLVLLTLDVESLFPEIFLKARDSHFLSNGLPENFF